MPHPYESIRTVFRGELLANEPLSRHTSLKVGGPADILAIPEDKYDLLELLGKLEELGIPWFVIGGGYNLLVRDKGFRGAAISLRKLDRVELRDDTALYAEAGAKNRVLADTARDSSLTGFEFLIGIPGTVGGALRMNAGAHGREIFDSVTSLEILSDGEVRKHAKNSLDYGYRHLQLNPNEIIISAEFRLVPGNREDITADMDSSMRKRHESQQVGWPNAGSYFRNPPEHAAWRLIDECGLRGFSIGGAQVSEVHANFLINRGAATALDFLKLAAIIKGQVLEKSGILLEEEVRIVGEE